MKLTGYENNAAVLAELAQRVCDQRIAANLTQADLAKKSGVSVRTISRLESGEGIALEKFLSVLRVLGLLRNVELLIPEYRMMPTDAFDGQKKRKRASSAAKKNASNNGWVWGDEK